LAYKPIVTGWRGRLRQSHVWASLRNAQREGPENAARRYFLWRRILRTEAIQTDPVSVKNAVEVHLLCHWRDYLPALWALKTFYWHAQVRYPLVIHTQGRMPLRAMRCLAVHFPNALIVDQTASDHLVENYLQEHKLARILAARRSNGFMLKLTDFILLGSSENLLTLDSDVLFFDEPVELLVGTDGPVLQHWFQQDPASTYNVTETYARETLDVELQPRINTGIMLFARQREMLEYCDGLLADSRVAQSTGWTEQTLYALYASRHHRVAFLPPSYQLSLSAGLQEGVIARHYAGPTRPLLSVEGMPSVIAQGLLGRTDQLVRTGVPQ